VADTGESRDTDIEVSTSVGKAKATFPSTSGVKLGDNLSPALFLFAIQATAESEE
jgi:hypothetical protein